jgi:hypothetical protein
MAKESTPMSAPGGAVPLAVAVQPQAQQPKPEAQAVAEKEHATEQSAKRKALTETAEATRRRAVEAQDKADKAMKEAQQLAQAANELKREAEAAEASANPDAARYVVAEGKSIFALSGQLGAFQEVRARDFQGGAQELEQHIKSGFIVLRNR